MIKYFFIIFLLSCESNPDLDKDNPFAELNQKEEVQENSQKKENIKNVSIDQESCYFGCSYFSKVIKGSKYAQEDSISLNLEQIESIKKECINQCKAVYK